MKKIDVFEMHGKAWILVKHGKSSHVPNGLAGATDWGPPKGSDFLEGKWEIPLCQGNTSISRQLLLGEILYFDIICPDSIKMLVIRLILFAALDVFRGFFWY